MTRWHEAKSRISGEQYAARFAHLAESGTNVHGEVDFCETWLQPGGRVLDAGCGTGRVAIELAKRGYQCIGVDVDLSMLSVARAAAPELVWMESDLADFDLGEDVSEPFDLIVAAGNVIPLVTAGTESAVIQCLADHLVPGGLLISGFGLDAAHLPLDAAPFTIEEYDAWCDAACLQPVDRFATWAGASFADSDRGYAVSVHRRAHKPG